MTSFGNRLCHDRPKGNSAPLSRLAEFEHLIQTNRAKWIRLAERKMAYEEAEDLVQDAVVRGWRFLGDFKGDSSMSTWMNTIVRNLIIDRRRRAEVRHEHIPVWSDNDVALVWVEESATRTVLLREVLELIYSGELTDVQVRGVMNKFYREKEPTGAMKMARYWGIRKLRAMMERAA